MSSIAKENETLIATPEAPAASPVTAAARSDEPAGRIQPVALEVPVTVNGARTVEGSDKREPFSETTQTVLVFGNGAVIRLSSAVAPGQLLFLTNEKTKKEVVCQVVKSKNYRNVSGYVELEFTEPVIGFWGMRFPTDRIAPAPKPAQTAPAASGIPSAPIAPPQPAAPKAVETKSIAPPIAQAPVKPAAFVSPSVPVAPVSAKPEGVVSSTSLSSNSPTSSVFSLPRAAEAPPAIVVAKPHTPVVPAGMNTTSLPRVAEMKPPAPPVPAAPTAQAHFDESTEALKQHTARLQEQLSSMQFQEAPAEKIAPSAPAIPPASSAALVESSAKVLEFAKPESTPLTGNPATIAQQPLRSLLEAEEIKIPAWLEPLARNAAAPATTQELIEREKTKQLAALNSKPELEELAAIPVPAAEPETPLELHVPSFGSSLAIDESQTSAEGATRGSSKGLLITAIAAGVILTIGAGAWYMRQPSGSTQRSVASPVASLPANAVPSQPQSITASQGNSALNSSAPASSSMPSSPSGKSAAVQNNSAPAAALLNASSRVDAPRAAQPAAAQPQPQAKKPSLGEVRFAAPTVNRSGASQEAGESAPNLEASAETGANGDALSPGIVGANSKQPSAPAVALAVGGDVKPAKMISAVQPIYPILAKSQHVSGDVKIDALIDANGRVTTMKVFSGPTLLHQAAMDALRQWKYQAATLDGKPVPMHLTVTLQFRMQQ